MKVNFYATYRLITGQKSVELELPVGSTIRDLVNQILKRYPDFNGQLMDENGSLFRHIHVFVNGRDTYYLPDDLETVLEQDENIDIFPPVAGG